MEDTVVFLETQDYIHYDVTLQGNLLVCEAEFQQRCRGGRRQGDLRRVRRKQALTDALWQRVFGKAKAF